jgi:hypothetical protein
VSAASTCFYFCWCICCFWIYIYPKPYIEQPYWSCSILLIHVQFNQFKIRQKGCSSLHWLIFGSSQKKLGLQFRCINFWVYSDKICTLTSYETADFKMFLLFIMFILLRCYMGESYTIYIVNKSENIICNWLNFYFQYITFEIFNGHPFLLKVPQSNLVKYRLHVYIIIS